MAGRSLRTLISGKTHGSGRREPLPSLNALQAFEATARHLSFTRAGEELGVTQTAISHQVRGLEQELEVALFRRAPQRLSLTPEGRAWAAELHGVFAQLRELNHKLRCGSEGVRPGVSVSVIPSFGSRWLVPRLGKFLLQYPELDVRIAASERLVDFAVEPFDVGIRYGFGRYPGLVSTSLWRTRWWSSLPPSSARGDVTGSCATWPGRR